MTQLRATSLLVLFAVFVAVVGSAGAHDSGPPTTAAVVTPEEAEATAQGLGIRVAAQSCVAVPANPQATLMISGPLRPSVSARRY